MIHCLQWLPSNYFLFSNLKSSVYSSTWGSPSQTLVVKNPPTVQDLQETWVRFLGGEDPLQKGIATHSSILAWKIPMDRLAWWAAVYGVTKSRTRLSS